jgi:hypothetical protein
VAAAVLVLAAGVAAVLFLIRGGPGEVPALATPIDFFRVAVSAAAPQPTPDPRPNVCASQNPRYLYGFKALSDELGPKMGEPLDCEYAIHISGDTRQQTTTGYAYYRKGSNTPAFTNGFDHWALTREGLVYWAGDVVDPPGAGVPAPAPPPAP